MAIAVGEGDATGINESKPRRPLNIRQHTGGPTRMTPPSSSVSRAKVRSPAPGTSSSVGETAGGRQRGGVGRAAGGRKLKKSTRKEMSQGSGTFLWDNMPGSSASGTAKGHRHTS